MISGSFLRDPDHAKGSEEHLGPKRNTRKRPLAARAYEVRGLGAWERLTIQALDEKKTNVITCSLNSTLHSGLGVQWRPVPLLRGFRSMGTGDRAPGARTAAGLRALPAALTSPPHDSGLRRLLGAPGADFPHLKKS